MRPAKASEMVMSKHWLRRLHTALVALALAFVPLGAGVNAADDLHRVAVVSFWLFGDQRVFQSEATGAAQIVASRFGADPTIVKFNSKKGGDATTASLAAVAGDRRRSAGSECVSPASRSKTPEVARLAP